MKEYGAITFKSRKLRTYLAPYIRAWRKSKIGLCVFVVMYLWTVISYPFRDTYRPVPIDVLPNAEREELLCRSTARAYESSEKEEEESRGKDTFKDSLVIGAVTNSAVVGTILGGDIEGAVVGDFLNGGDLDD